MKIENDTKTRILEQALNQASLYGLEALSIGKLAQEVNMSKSGIFGHFNSKENLQIELLDYAAERFRKDVFKPALLKPKGKERILTLAENWTLWTTNSLPGGCPILAAIMEYDDRPGPVRDHFLKMIQTFHLSLVHMSEIAKQAGDFSGDVDSEQFAFEFFSLILGFHHALRMLSAKNARKRFLKAIDSLIHLFSS
ncbi:MAG: TetR/AcrR family transcriptional regulator [Deltaproteobacteria bacterium]|nr:TetR/AcrR family transcriptional regulator [Deltaproteobacteria bacterium]